MHNMCSHFHYHPLICSCMPLIHDLDWMPINGLVLFLLLKLHDFAVLSCI